MAKYKEEFVNEIMSWVKEHGLIDYGGAKLKDFCERFGIDFKTYYKWLEKPEFKKSLDEAKEHFKKNLANDLVNSLAMAAKGYDKEETEIEYVPGKDGKPVIKKQRNKKVHYFPNIAAAIFLLTNIDSENFQNKQRMNVEGKVDNKIEIGFVETGIEPVESEDEIEERDDTV